jgi:hypothetical protein
VKQKPGSEEIGLSGTVMTLLIKSPRAAPTSIPFKITGSLDLDCCLIAVGIERAGSEATAR